MSDLETRRQAAKDAFRDAIVARLVDLGVPHEAAFGAVVLHVSFNATLDDPIHVLAIHDGVRYIDDPRSLVDLARIISDAHCGVPLSSTRAARPGASPLSQHQRLVSTTF